MRVLGLPLTQKGVNFTQVPKHLMQLMTTDCGAVPKTETNQPFFCGGGGDLYTNHRMRHRSVAKK